MSLNTSLDFPAKKLSENPDTESVDSEAQGKSSKADIKGQTLEIVLTVVCGVSMVTALVLEKLSSMGSLAHALYTIAYLSGGYFGLLASISSLRKLVFDVDLLMILAALGAAYVGAEFEGAMLLFLFSLSNAMQTFALDRSRKAIKALVKLRPNEAICKTEDGFKARPIDTVSLGTIIRLRPGDRIPLDGVIQEGNASVDQSTLTGESVPVNKAIGDPVFAGSINQTGSLLVRVTKLASESTLARIIGMVETAQARKATTERFLENAERYYALGVILLTLGLIFIPPTFSEISFSDNFYRAMTVMVVASPCALIISTPAAFLSAIAGAARRGVLFKGGVHLERLSIVDTIAFDKTGTLTQGVLVVNDVAVFENLETGLGTEQLLQIAASIENHSEHPIARAVENAAKEAKLDLLPTDGFTAVAGKGAEATVSGKRYLVGNPEFIRQRNGKLNTVQLETLDAVLARGFSVILVAQTDSDGMVETPLGLISVSDQLRTDAAATVKKLKQLGIRKVVMLTGDAEKVASETAKLTGVDAYHANLLPEDKLRLVEQLSKTGKVAMVGDGVNDAPALAAATVGIAMGAAGTDVAMETADVVLMSNQLDHIVQAVALARRSRRIVIQNLGFSFSVILVLVTSALTFGIALPLGVVGHEGSTVLVCLNGLRLLNQKRV